MVEDVVVLACATDEKDSRVMNFVKSFERHKGWDLRIVGSGMEWRPFRTKMECYCEALAIIPPRQVVVCLDAYDVLCMRDSHNLVQDFLSCKVPIVVGMEESCLFTMYNRYVRIGVCPSIDRWKIHHGYDKDEAIHVNSGCIVGYSGEILRMFQWVLSYEGFPIDDDQIGAGFYMDSFPERVQLDTKERFVVNHNAVTKGDKHRIIMSNGRITVDNRRVPPYFLHFPGTQCAHTKTSDYYRVAHYLYDDPTYIDGMSRCDWDVRVWAVLLFGAAALLVAGCVKRKNEIRLRSLA